MSGAHHRGPLAQAGGTERGPRYWQAEAPPLSSL